MSEHCYRVGIHGPPDPVKHPWVMVKFDGSWWRLIHVPDFPGRHWADGELWFPVEAPPSELAPEPEDWGVEVDGERFRVSGNVVEVQYRGAWSEYEYRENLVKYATIAQALGLVPAVPASLVDAVRGWAEQELVQAKKAPHDQFHSGTWAAYRRVLTCLERGEFGPVEGVDR